MELEGHLGPEGSLSTAWALDRKPALDSQMCSKGVDGGHASLGKGWRRQVGPVLGTARGGDP